MRPKLSFLATTIDAMFGEESTRHLLKDAPFLLWNMEVVRLCFGDVWAIKTQETWSKLVEWWMQQFIKKIWRRILHSSAKFCMGRSRIFQDNYPKHKAKSTCHWLKQNKVTVLEWPSQSRDLSIIEPLWAELKRAVHVRQHKNLQELESFCQEHGCFYNQRKKNLLQSPTMSPPSWHWC